MNENNDIIELLPGMTMTGSAYCFQGRVEVLKVIESKNELLVSLASPRLDSDRVTHISEWEETWNLQHTLTKLSQGGYFLSNDFYWYNKNKS